MPPGDQVHTSIFASMGVVSKSRPTLSARWRLRAMQAFRLLRWDPILRRRPKITAPSGCASSPSWPPRSRRHSRKSGSTFAGQATRLLIYTETQRISPLNGVVPGENRGLAGLQESKTTDECDQVRQRVPAASHEPPPRLPESSHSSRLSLIKSLADPPPVRVLPGRRKAGRTDQSPHWGKSI